MVIGGAAMIGYYKFALLVLHTPRPRKLAPDRTPDSGVSLRLSVSCIISSVQYSMSHNGDSQTERDGDERPETVSIGELLRSAHETSHRLIRHLRGLK